MSLSLSRGIFKIFDKNCGVVDALPGDKGPAHRLPVVDQECRELAPGIPASPSRFFWVLGELLFWVLDELLMPLAALRVEEEARSAYKSPLNTCIKSRPIVS
jgi:hypothetical protein